MDTSTPYDPISNKNDMPKEEPILVTPEVLPFEDEKPSEAQSQKALGAAQMAAGGALALAGLPLLVLPGPGAVFIVGGATLASKGQRNYTGRSASPLESKLDALAAKMSQAAKDQAKQAAKTAAKEAPQVAKNVVDQIPLITKKTLDAAPGITKKVIDQAPKVAEKVVQHAPGAAKKLTKGAGAVANATIKATPIVVDKIAQTAPKAAEKIASSAPEVAGKVISTAPSVAGTVTKGLFKGAALGAGLVKQLGKSAFGSGNSKNTQ